MINGGDGVFALLALVPIIFYLALTGFFNYFVVKIIKFVNEENKIRPRKG